MSDRSALALIFVLSIAAPGTAYADWSKLKGYLKADAIIVSESKERLVIRHPNVAATIAVTAGPALDADIHSALARRRGGNPYRVWVAGAALWSGKKIPRRQWGLFFKASFLRILRRPRRS